MATRNVHTKEPEVENDYLCIELNLGYNEQLLLPTERATELISLLSKAYILYEGGYGDNAKGPKLLTPMTTARKFSVRPLGDINFATLQKARLLGIDYKDVENNDD